ncbi:unnamed protein product [Ranitomeya imitator]|uniref:Lactate/malate dehydrogenase C-terminal domain-containing protein n=1 Tax=Ranitomeya imitator TaxID=111125 RepID=A0ABN9MSS8_9NEOB|nr:unnamed protein product [Ranitomeya imitator]
MFIKDVVVWGNISGINLLDLHLAKMYKYDSSIWGPSNFSRPLLHMIHDRKWLKNDVVTEWKKRKEHRSGLSAAHSIATAISYWQQDSCAGRIVSLGVRNEDPQRFPQHVHIPLELGYVHTVRIWLRIRSGLAAADSQQCSIRFTVPCKPMENQIRCAHGFFNLPDDIVFSMPVTFQNGDWQVCTDITIQDDAKETLLQAAVELIKEKNFAFGILQVEKIAPEEPNGEELIGNRHNV